MKKIILTIWILLALLTSQTALATISGPGAGGPSGPLVHSEGVEGAESVAESEETPTDEDIDWGSDEEIAADTEALDELNNEDGEEASTQSTTVTETTESEDDKQRRLNSEKVRTAEAYADNCYGYPGGDTQDSSDFALKVDCILKTSDQNLSFFTYGEGERTVADGGPAPIEKVVIKIINTLIVIIGSVSMLLIVIAGFMMITSPGNENQRSKATEILTSAIISLVVAFSSYIIVNAVVGLFF